MRCSKTNIADSVSNFMTVMPSSSRRKTNIADFANKSTTTMAPNSSDSTNAISNLVARTSHTNDSMGAATEWWYHLAAHKCNVVIRCVTHQGTEGVAYSDGSGSPAC
jgi:hypothetical protein